MLLDEAAYFNLSARAALKVVSEVGSVVSRWRAEARSAKVGLTAAELDDFAPAFEHEAMADARAALDR